MSQFSRSNVNDAAFSKGSVDRSSYNLNIKTVFTPKLGAFHPVRCTRLMPNSTVQGSVSPSLELEKVISPQIGRTRLDTHTFAVPFRRICQDFKIGLEKQNFSDGELLTLGQFDIYELYNVLFSSLFFYRTSTHGTISALLRLSVPTNLYGKVQQNVRDAGLPDLTSVTIGSDPDYSYSDYALFCVSNLSWDLPTLIFSALDHIRLIYAMYAFDDDEQGLLNYPKDFYAQEYLRLSDYLSYLSNLSSDVFYDLNMYDVICYILEPYVGINSNADMLGYPILRQYGSLSSFFHSSVASSIQFVGGYNSTLNPAIIFNIENNDGIEYLFLISSFLLPYTGICVFENYGSVIYNGYLNPFKLYPGIFNDYSASGLNSLFDFQQQLPYRQYSDFPLRAAYACWFDRMRDWHVENRSKCLDPDSFTKESLFLRIISLGHLHEGKSVLDIPALRSLVYALLVPRQRFYADDALTTIKTDDKFRHIYSPILQLEDVSGTVDTKSEDMLNQIEKIYIDSLAIAFPSGNLFGNLKSDTMIQSLRNDLCLAKRAGMLERWLARNYFTPDNYNGFISAHFDTDVSDMDMLISKYIGGSEQMVSGEQQVADISTEQSVRGTRTFSGGVSSDSSFSIQVSDYYYIVSFVSLVPLVEYDSLNPAVLETNFNELPSPEYANDTRIEARLSDFIRDFPLSHDVIGYVPRYYLDRTSLDSVHGRYLTDYRSYSWFRDWYNMTFVSGSKFGEHGFSLTPYSLRVNLPLDSFLGLAPWNTIAYGKVDLPLAVNVPLSAAVEII